MALQAGAITQVVVSPTTASLLAQPPTGGSGNYTYQWFRGTLSNFTPGNGTPVAGGTGLSLLDVGPLTPNTIYYYILVNTDLGNPPTNPPNVPLVFNSATFGICTSPNGQTLYPAPALADFYDIFDLDFPYQSDFEPGADPAIYVRDKDVLKAFQQANNAIRLSLFGSQSDYFNAFMLMAAHQLVENKVNSSQGVQGQYDWNQIGKSGGGMSESFQIPELIAKNPTFAGWAKTTYGSKYLRIILPRLAGPADSVFGNTKP